MWNKELTFMFKTPYLSGEPIATDTKCPLCSDPDSAGHMLRHCQHTELNAHYIARHYKTIRRLLKEVMKVHVGSHFTLADVCQP